MSFRPFLRGVMSSGASTAFTPLSLFASGEQGAWYDPSDLTTLFQDAAGTTAVTADGDPVGYMGDKSGNGNHATAAWSAARPTYRTDGTLHWIELDGVDDFLEISAYPFGSMRTSGSLTIATSCDDLTDVNENVISITGAGPDVYLDSVSGHDLRVFSAPDSITKANAVTAINTPTIFTGQYDQTKIYAYHDGAFLAEKSATVGTLTMSPIQFAGKRWNRIYGAVVLDEVRPSNDIANLHEWLADKSGVTL